MKTRFILYALPLCATLSSTAGAQSALLSFEGGMRTDEHQNGITRTVPFWGFGLSGTIQGSADEHSAFLIPFSAEVRLSYRSVSDVNGFMDAALRIENFTFGGGAAGTWDSTPAMKDASLGTSNGKVNINYPISLGYSGFAKLALGKLFFQGRYVMMPKGYDRYYRSAADREAIDNGTLTVTDPPQKDSPLLRFSAGYVMDKWIWRVQAIEEKWNYERVNINRTGIYDRKSRILSVGVIRIM
jgi:hypothetical protein